MKPTFDKSKDYGQITPFWHGAAYQQDGCYFSAQGEFLFRDGDDPEAAEKARASALAAPPAKQAAKSAKQPAQKVLDTPKASAPETQEGDTESQPEAFDLAAWASGEMKAPFFTVKKHMLLLDSEADVSSAAAIKAELVSRNVIKAD
jgi:FtsZ-interacting cell division protein ZipA